MVIAVDARREDEADDDDGEERHPMRYLPLGRVYSSTAPCPPLAARKPSHRAAPANSKPPVIVYYRRRHKRPRLQDPLPITPKQEPLDSDPDPEPEPEPEGRGSRRKRPLRQELLNLGPSPPALGAEERRRQPRRAGGAESSTSAGTGTGRRPRHGGHKEAASSSTGKRWVE
jgi:hypothetical protein